MKNSFASLLILLAAAHSAQASDAIKLANRSYTLPSHCNAPAALTTAPLTLQGYEQLLIDTREQGLTALDWQIDESANVCGGYYQSPVSQSAPSDMRLDQGFTHMSANHIEQQLNGASKLSGNVLFTQEQLSAQCDQLIYDQANGTAELSGNISFRLPNNLILAQKANINTRNQNLDLEDIQLVIHQAHARIGAKHLNIEQISGQQGNNQKLFLQDASFTTCPPNDDTWSLATSELRIDYDKGWGNARHARFYLKNVPIAYLPYFDFPIDDRRKTGVLFPSISFGSDGFDYQQSYYINLAPNYDMTLSPRYVDSHGLLHNIEGRYLNKQSLWKANISYIPDDKEIGDVRYEDDKSLERERWAIHVEEKGQITPFLSHSIDYTNVSDIDFLRDWAGPGLAAKHESQLKREATLKYFSQNQFRAGKLHINTRFIDYKSLEWLDKANNKVKDSDYQLQPEIDLRFASSQLTRKQRLSPTSLQTASHSLGFNLENLSSFFVHDSKDNTNRNYFSVNTYYQAKSQALSFYTHIRHQNLYYSVDDQKDAPTQSSNSFVSDLKLNLARPVLWNDNIEQEITPRLFYTVNDAREEADIYAFDFDTSELGFNYAQSFREERFSGHDRLGDNHKVTLGISTVLNNLNEGYQHFEFGISQSIYLDEREVSLGQNDKTPLTINPTDTQDAAQYKRETNALIKKNFERGYSDVALYSTARINAQHRLFFDAVLDPQSSNTEEAGIRWQMRKDTHQIANFAIRFDAAKPALIDTDNNSTTDPEYVKADLYYADFSLVEKINPQWMLFTKASWDIKKEESIDTIAGVKYQNCCWSITIAGQNERRSYYKGERIDLWDESHYDQRWFIEFELKGLGSGQGAIYQLLENTIEGFKP